MNILVLYSKNCTKRNIINLIGKARYDLVITNDSVSLNVPVKLISYGSFYKENKEYGKVAGFIDNVQVQNSCNIQDALVYKDVYIYDFLRKENNDRIHSLLLHINVMANIMREYKDENISIASDDAAFLECAKFFNKDFTVLPLRSGNKLFIRGIYFKLFAVPRAVFGLLYLLLIKLFVHSDFLFFTHAMDINKLIIGKKVKYMDVQLGLIIDKLKRKGYKVIEFEMFSKPKDALKSFLKLKPVLPYEIILVMMYFVTNKNKMELFVDKLNKISFPQKVMYNNMDISCLVDKIVFSDYLPRISEIIHRIDVLCCILKLLNVKKAFIMDEACSGRFLAAACRILDIKTAAIQHGTFSPSGAPELCFRSRSRVCTVDKTFLWGDRFKNILIHNSNHYCEENVEVTGQPRTDLVGLYERKADMAAKKNTVNILYAPQHGRVRVPGAEFVFHALAPVKERVNLFIKTHPVEPKDDLYKSMARKYGFKNIRIYFEYDLYKLLSTVDLVITVHSSVAVEAAVFNRPGFMINLPGEEEIIRNFTQSGVVRVINTPDDLRGIVEHGLDNKDWSKAKEKYVEENFYKVDGKVTDRIIESFLTL